MNEMTKLIMIVVAAVLIGFIFGWIASKPKVNGTIVIEPTEDDRERIRWVLDMDLDGIKEQKLIIFKVEDTTSKKPQTL